MSPAHRLFAVILARDGYRCVYCEATPDEDGEPLSVDHVIPRANTTREVGDDNDAPSNLVTACRYCNSLKRDMTLPVFAMYLMESRGWTPQRIVAMMDRVRVATARRVSV